MQHGDVDGTLLVALQVLPSVSIFLTGFVSVLIHAQLDRALARVDALEELLKRLVDADHSGAAGDLTDVSSAHAGALAVRPSARYADIVNIVVLLLVVFLSGLALWQGGWRFALHPFDLPAPPSALAAIVAVQTMICLVGWLDHRSVNGDLAARAEATIWGKVAVVDRLVVERRDLARAARLANVVFDAVPGMLWPIRLRARVHLAMAVTSTETAEAVRAAEIAIAEIDRVLQAKQTSTTQRPLAPELRLRAWGRELLGDVEAAAQDVAAALTEQPSDPELWLRQGALLEQLGTLDQARHAYEQAAQLDSLGVDPALALARFYLRIHQPEPASIILEEALELAPAHPEVRRLYRQTTNTWARVLLSRGHFEEARAFLDYALHHDPGNTDGVALRALAAQRVQPN